MSLTLARAPSTLTARWCRERKPLTFGKDPELMKRRHEFIVKNQHDQTIVREPGYAAVLMPHAPAPAERWLGRVRRKIAGQQFIIGDCTGCNIYLFDHIGTITIDMCKNCRIFIGPCASSAFIRDCKNCEIIAAVQQLRTRDCSSIRMLLYSQTAPIVESSHGMSFGCFNFGYEKLQGAHSPRTSLRHARALTHRCWLLRVAAPWQSILTQPS